jgi:thymidylate synthase
MRVIEGEDVNELYWRGMNLLQAEGVKADSRNGPVVVMPCPVTSVYKKPRQRVLLDLKRAANPFFHLFESLWMLRGRDDVSALNRFITDFGSRFAEEDGRIHGAYGHRWRHALGFDQLNAIVERLKDNPNDRQAVLQMWDGRASHHEGCNDLLGNWKDRPCNTHVYFRVREDIKPSAPPLRSMDRYQVLDMFISCRSNDIIFGAYGANAVHFSILQEYMAARIGVEVGVMHQMSFNFHAYQDVLDRVGVPSYLETYRGHELRAQRMVTTPERWDRDLDDWFLWHRNLIERGEDNKRTFDDNPWFNTVACPMFIAHFKFKSAMHDEAMRTAQTISATDWRFACTQWFNIRANSRSR